MIAGSHHSPEVIVQLRVKRAAFHDTPGVCLRPGCGKRLKPNVLSGYCSLSCEAKELAAEAV